MAIKSYYKEDVGDYYVVDTFYDIMELTARHSIYIKVSKRYLDKDNDTFINKGYEE